MPFVSIDRTHITNRCASDAQRMQTHELTQGRESEGNVTRCCREWDVEFVDGGTFKKFLVTTKERARYFSYETIRGGMIEVQR